MRKNTLAAAAAAALLMLPLAACGSDSDSGSSAATGEITAEAKEKAAEARELVDAAKEIPSADDLGDPIDAKSLQGKTIYSIPIDSKAEFYVASEKAMKAVADEAGVEYVTFASDGSQTSYQQGFNQAINAKAAAILLNGPLPETLGPQIDAAKKAGIPVVPLHISDAEGEGAEGIEYEAFAPFNAAARLMTLAAIADLEGAPVNALVIETSETGPSDGMVETIEDTLEEFGPEGSKVTVVNSAVTAWSSKLQGQVQSALLKDKNINTILPIYDNQALYAAPAVRQAAADRGIRIYTFNGTPSILKMVADGEVAVDVAENPDWVALVNMDTAFRAMLGVDPIEGATGPLRLIDESNVAETGNPPASGQGFGDEYQQAFRTLWGLS